MNFASVQNRDTEGHLMSFVRYGDVLVCLLWRSLELCFWSRFFATVPLCVEFHGLFLSCEFPGRRTKTFGTFSVS